jgi:hypothetical protein
MLEDSKHFPESEISGDRAESEPTLEEIVFISQSSLLIRFIVSAISFAAYVALLASGSILLLLFALGYYAYTFAQILRKNSLAYEMLVEPIAYSTFIGMMIGSLLILGFFTVASFSVKVPLNFFVKPLLGNIILCFFAVAHADANARYLYMVGASFLDRLKE